MSKEYIFPSYEDVMIIHDNVLADTGGLSGLRDENLLISAVEGVFQTFGGEELYPTFEEKVAKLGHSIISNHVFSDGNKRTGTMVMLTTLEANGVWLNDGEIAKSKIFIEKVASGEKTYEDVLSWIKIISKR